jgi:hypothetical protein
MRGSLGVDLPPGPAPNPAVQPTRLSRPTRSGDTVTVACKLPHGLILRCFREEKFMEPTQTGARETTRFMPIDEMQFTIRGTWVGSAGQAFAKNNPSVAELLPGGYALTHGVPREIWDNWYAANKKSQIVRNKVVFAYGSESGASDAARQLRGVKSGLEPLDPDRPADRLPGGVDRRLRVSMLKQDEEGTSAR